MKSPWIALALAAALPCTQAQAADPADPAPARGGEPAVKRTVVEDEGARIEELRVRGLTQRIVVTPKRGGGARYEILAGEGARDLAEPAGRGAAGQRVWHILSF